MDRKTKNRRILGWVMLILAICVMLAAGSLSLSLKRPEVTAKMVQRSVTKVEKDIQSLIDNNANYHQYDLAEM